MTTLGTLIEKVEQRIPDTGDFLPADITELLNDGYAIVSAAVKLPGLDATAEVTAVIDDISVSLPDDYQRGLYRCKVKATGRDVKIVNSLAQMVTATGSLEGTGDITHVTVVGRKLYYQGKPTAEVVLVLYYYRKPTPMVEAGDEPSALPDHYQKRLLQSYALGEIFEEIEAGLDGATPDTTRHQGKFWALVDALKREIREGVSNPTPSCTGIDI